MAHLLGSEVRGGVDEEWLVPDVLLDLLSRSLSISEAFFCQGNLPVGDVNVCLGGTEQNRTEQNRAEQSGTNTTGRRHQC